MLAAMERNSLPSIETLPILPLRNSVLFPASIVPVNVGRLRSVKLIEGSFGKDKPIIAVVAQKNPDLEDPLMADLYSVGTIARILKVVRLSSGSYSVIFQGISRMRITTTVTEDPFLQAVIEKIPEPPRKDEEIAAFAAQLREHARRLFDALPQVPREAIQVLENVGEPGALSDLIASNLPLGTLKKQEILEQVDIRDRIRKLNEWMSHQSEVLRVKQEIHSSVTEEISKNEREMLLRSQMKEIRKELGEVDDEDDVEVLREKVIQSMMPPDVEKIAKKQLSRMRSMSQGGSEFHVTKSYVEWLTEMPWNKTTPDRLDVKHASAVLDADHYGLEKIKKRILEFIAVRKLKSDMRGPILCFVGPPGVGKTSLAKSIAKATGRNFARIALGGVHDEAEIRGHRRTYVGSYPGRFIAGLKTAKSKNPLFLLDEIDKMTGDSKGDPKSALLEVLDPEQNNTFIDHYLEVPFDLSNVLFIATANRLDTIPRPLLDRMEVIQLAGYVREEKISIAKEFLIPKQLSEHGLSVERLEFTTEGIDFLVDHYTREAGVRTLEQKIAGVCRHLAVQLAEGKDLYADATPAFIAEALGPPIYEKSQRETSLKPGISTGLSWTPSGGDLMLVESSQMPGSGQIHLTGKIGDVMKESIAAAFTYIRTRPEQLGLDPDFLSRMDVHLHLPNGAVPKDGPSNGIAIFVSLASMLTHLSVKPEVGMMGEITLRGMILPVTGIKEKCLAAHRAGLTDIILPLRNKPDLEELPKNILTDLKFHFVSNMNEVLPLALTLPVGSQPTQLH